MPHDRESNIATIQEKLDALRRRDLFRLVFGATHHRYRTVRVTSQGLESFEEHLAVRLAVEYRSLLLDVGYRAGPYYGLLPPSRVLKQLITIDGQSPDQRRSSPDASRPFPLTSIDLADWHARSAGGEAHPPVNFAGTVWSCCEDPPEEYVPGYRPAGVVSRRTAELAPLPSPPTFSEWYTGWIEQGLADLAFWPPARLRRFFRHHR